MQQKSLYENLSNLLTAKFNGLTWYLLYIAVGRLFIHNQTMCNGWT